MNPLLAAVAVRKSWRNLECMRPANRNLRSRRAFTLTELLVVILVVGFGVVVLAPALARTQPASKTFQCLNNHRQLVNAWRMYSVDYNDRVANNFGINEVLNAISIEKFDNWANNVMSWSASGSVTDRSITNVAWVTNSVMGKYADAPVSAYRCPSDVFLSPPQRALGWTARLRSVSMNSVFGRFSDGNDSTAQGLNWALPQYLQCLNSAQVTKPAKTWLFIEEHPDSINEGYFVNNTSATTWQDIPAAFHNGGCTFSFADGHAEVRKWLSATSQYSVRFQYPNVRSFDAQGRLDFAWYLERTGYVLKSSGLPQFGY
jgi:prepilin-type processing-associated H-X9-DG protein/prepilin-type N-terminal cleavage/methylation domain-containing protein